MRDGKYPYPRRTGTTDIVVDHHKVANIEDMRRKDEDELRKVKTSVYKILVQVMDTDGFEQGLGRIPEDERETKDNSSEGYKGGDSPLEDEQGDEDDKEEGDN